MEGSQSVVVTALKWIALFDYIPYSGKASGYNVDTVQHVISSKALSTLLARRALTTLIMSKPDSFLG